MFLATQQPYSFGPGPASWALRRVSGRARQGLFEVSDQIGWVLYSYRQPQQVGRCGRARNPAHRRRCRERDLRRDRQAHSHAADHRQRSVLQRGVNKTLGAGRCRHALARRFWSAWSRGPKLRSAANSKFESYQPRPEEPAKRASRRTPQARPRRVSILRVSASRFLRMRSVELTLTRSI